MKRIVSSFLLASMVALGVISVAAAKARRKRVPLEQAED
jgi:hypothetical protein